MNTQQHQPTAIRPSAGTAPRVSVVTPFYNTASYLEQCIKSVLSQSLTNFEYVLADNCSDDGSEQIARHYAALDRRIVLMRFDVHLPQVENYNRAIRHIHPGSQYCKIVQADDWIFPECLERMVALADAHPTIGIVGSYFRRGTKVVGGGPDPDVPVYPGTEVARAKLLTGTFGMGSPTSVMYRADLVRARSPFYPTGRYNEDTDIVYELLAQSDFGFVPQLLCVQRVGNPSIRVSIDTFEHVILDRFIQVETYADRFLTPVEAENVRRDALRQYTRALAKHALRIRDNRFWGFHKTGLATVGRKLPVADITRIALMNVVRSIMNPLDSVLRLKSKLRKYPPRRPE